MKIYTNKPLRSKLSTNTRILAICKINGTFKKTNKKTNVSRHVIRWQKNTKFLEGWTLKEW